MMIDESSALLQFKSSFTKNPFSFGWTSLSENIVTWKNGTDCCSWDGITCDTISGHVIGLNLGREGIE
ncbi:receptor-like protein kinase, partial [Trifolium medium]|nr:receptor-like protein kinase [Trifolium medium]